MYSQKLVYNDHPWDPKIVAVVDRWSLFIGNLCSKSPKWDHKMVVAIRRWSLAQVWLYFIFVFLLTNFTFVKVNKQVNLIANKVTELRGRGQKHEFTLAWNTLIDKLSEKTE